MAACKGSRLVCTAGPIALALTVSVSTSVYAQQPIAGANVNMIRGTTLPDGDPSMQRQNEPSIAISTRNPCHLLAGANDYRIVTLPDPLADPDPTPGMASDAWLSIMKSFDCGATWQSSLLIGYPDDPRPEAPFSPLRGYQAGADPTVRAGTNGLFYYSGMVFDRGSDGKSRLFVARLVDNNDRERGDTIQHLGTAIVEDGTKGQFVDKPWMAVDIPRAGYGPQAAYWTTSDDLAQANPNANAAPKQGGSTCTVNGQSFPAGHVYLAWTRFDGQSASSTNTKIMFARSTDCGVSWHARPISSNQKLSQGAMIAIAPDDGTVYVAWREFASGGRPAAVHMMRSRDGGSSFDKPKAIIPSFTAFDHPKTPFTFRSNALPTVAAAPDGLVYVAVAARGYGRNLNGTANDDSRIILTVSRDAGVTFAAPFAIDNNPREPNPQANPTSPPRGHQFMPALAYAAGKLQIAFYDARDDVALQRGSYISDDPALAGNLFRHTVDVRGSWATVDKANPIPAFAVFTKTPQGVSENTTLKLSKYAQSATKGTVHFNYANLTMYQAGALPFIGDYMDTQGLTAIPIRTANDVQQWRPNIPVDFSGMSALSTQDFPMLPIFHTAWGDNRDVKWLAKVPGPYFDIKNQFEIPAFCEAALDVVGIRNANIYTSRMTPGLYVGSTGNTKPLGFVRDPVTGAQVLIRRGFTAFVQNTTSTRTRYRLQIVNQPTGGRASFRQSDEDPKTHVDRGPLTTLDADVPAGSSVARTVYAQASDRFAQILINVFELEGVPGTDPEGKPITIYNPKPNGLRSSLLLNPDKTNPAIKDPDLILDPNDPQVIPQIAIAESHDPRISEAFAFDLSGLLTTRRAITVPTQGGDPNDPNAGVKTPDLESPDLESPDLESPDLESPDLESPDLESGALGEGESLARIRDIHWTAKNGGNTTTTYRFRPSVNGDTTGLKFQMVVSRRYLAPAIDPNTCKLVFKTVSQVVVNVPNFEPRSPDLESPDLESPDLESPDLESPDLESASMHNVTFALAPGEEATMTLRVMKVTKETKAEEAAGAAGIETGVAAGQNGDASFDGSAMTTTSALRSSGSAFSTGAAVQSASCTSILDVDANGKPCGTRVATTAFIQSQAANCVAATCNAEAPSASAGPDLAVPETSLLIASAAPGGSVRVTATVTNVGNRPAETPFATRFFLSADDRLTLDSEGSITDIELSPAFSHDVAIPAEGTVHIANHQVTIPRGTAPGSYFVIAYTDGAEQVFEPDDFLAVNQSNNLFAAPVTVGFVVSFSVQPSQTTQDFSIAPPVVVSVTDGTGAPVSAAAVPFVTMSLNDGVLGGTLVQPNVNGQFTFNDLNVHDPGDHALIAVAAGTLPAATSALFNVKVDAPPVTVDDAYVVDEDQALETASDNEGLPPGPLQNDIDEINAGPGIAPAGRQLTIVIVSQPTHGTVTLRPDGQNFVYTPAANYSGPDSFTYRAHDGLQSSALPAGTVSITVRLVNDAPTADAQSLSTPEDTPLDITLTGSDEESDSLEFTIVTEPAHGTLTGSGASWSYTPNDNYHGSDSFTFSAIDGSELTSEPATIAITITPVNDAPVAASQTVATARNTPVEITLEATDVDSEELTFTIVTSPVHGSLSGTPPNLTYTPDEGFADSDAFTFAASDGLATSDVATVSIVVRDTDNVAPTAVDDSAATFTNRFVDINVVGNDTDAETTAPGRLITHERFSPATTSIGLGFVNETARVASTGLLYVSGNRGIAVVDPNGAAIVHTIAVPQVAPGQANFHQVNNTTSIVYFRHGANMISAVDARPPSPTFNQMIGRLQIGGNVQSFALDEGRGLLYVTTTSSGTQIGLESRLSIVDADPTHAATFHTIIGELVIGSTNARGIVVDPVGDRVYIAADTGLIRVDSASTSDRSQSVINTGGLLDLVMGAGQVFGYGGGTPARIAAYDPATGTATTFNSSLTGNFSAGRRIVFHAASNRVFVRSGGLTGAAGKVVVIDGNTSTWPANAVLAEIGVGRDGLSDLVVDQARGLVVTSSATDNRVSVIDGVANPPALNGAAQSLQVGADIELDPTTGTAYLAVRAILQRVVLDPRATLAPIHLGGENGPGVALAGSATAPNFDRFYVGFTALGGGIRKFTIDGTASDVELPHKVGRFVFAGANTQLNRLYVLNSDANSNGIAAFPSSVAVISAATGAHLATVDVGNGAFGLAVNETTNRIYTGGSPSGLFPGGISVIDGSNHSVSAVDVSAFPAGTGFNRYIAPLCVGAVCSTVNKVYVQAVQQNVVTVAVVNGATNVATPMSPSVGANDVTFIRASNALNRVFIARQTDFGNVEAPTDILVIRGDTDAKVTTLVGIASPTTAQVTQSFVAVDEQRGRVYAIDFANDRLNVLNALVEQGCSPAQTAPSANCYPLLTTVATGDGPTSIAIDVAANRIYVTNANDETLTFIDGDTFKVVGTLPLPMQPTTMALDTSSPLVTYILISGSFAEPGAMLVADVRGVGTLSVAPDSLTPPENGEIIINPDGTVRYTPAIGFAGTDRFTYRVTDGIDVSANAATVTVDVRPLLTITTEGLAQGTRGQPYAANVSATGGTPPYFWTFLGAVPGGIRPNNSTATLSGTPGNAGNFPITVDVRDSSTPQQQTQRDFVLVVGPFEVVTTGLPTARLNQSYTTTLQAGGSAATPFIWDLAPGSTPLPEWLRLNEDGTLTADSVQAATCSSISFTVRATDQLERTATRTLTLFFSGPIRITSTTFNAVALENFAPGITTTCGSGTRTWSMTGGLPRGVTFNATTGRFSSDLPSPNPLILLGPKETGVFPVDITVSDASGSDRQTVIINVHAVDQQPFSGGETNLAIDSAIRIAQTVTVGASGRLTAVRLLSMKCAVPPQVTVRIVGVNAANGEPDESEEFATAAITGAGQIIPIPESPFFAVDERFAVVLSTNTACSLGGLNSSDNYVSGTAFVSAGGGSWTTPTTSSGAVVADFPMQTLIQNPALTYLNGNRGQGRAVMLNDGRVLMIGSNGVAEVIDLQTGAITPVAMTATRLDPTVTLLADGRVLVTGGSGSVGGVTTYHASAELFDPATDTFAATGSMSQTRRQHAAVLLKCPTENPCGFGDKVLVTGGHIQTGPNTFPPLSTTELYDPATGGFTTGASMIHPRNAHQLTRLSDGRVLVSGGFGESDFGTAEIYDPAAGTFAATAAMLTRRAEHSATLLPDGTVLIAGGRLRGNARAMATRGEIYRPAPNPADATFEDAGPLVTPRSRQTVTLLTCAADQPDCPWNGNVLLTGGIRNWEFTSSYATSERYVPGSGFVGGSSMNVTRYDHGAVPLSDGRVLITGGFSGQGGGRQNGQTFEFLSPSPGADGTPSISNPNLPDGFVGTPYPETTLTPIGGTPPYTISIDPASLPPGLSTNGPTISGTPTAPGTYPFAVQITDSAVPPHIAVQTLRIRINALDITTSALPNAYIGKPYATTVEATGVGAKRWTIAGNVPPGNPAFAINASTGEITGTATVTGVYDFLVRVTDAVGQVAFRTLSIQVNNPLTITTTTLGDGILGNTYGGCVNQNFGIGQYTWTLSGNFPEGLAFRNSGVNDSCFDTAFPARQLRQTGTFTFTVTVTDSSVPPQSDSQELTLQIHAHEQQLGGPDSTVPLNPGERYAQVFTAGSVFELSGIELWSIRSCSANTTINAEIRPVIGVPARPDDTVAPLATASVITSNTGGFSATVRLSSPVAIPQHGRFAVIFSLQNGSCQGNFWPTTDFYNRGDGWTDRGAGWQLLSEVNGRTDVGINTLVLPRDMPYLRSRRHDVTSVELQDGRFLLLGPDNTAEIYDPATHTLSATGSMNEARTDATATLLADGRVVVIGGQRFDQATQRTLTLTSVEVFDPRGNGGIGSFSTAQGQPNAGAGNVNVARTQHAATLLNDGSGRILVTGGWSQDTFQSIRSAELYDADTGSSTAPFDMLVGRHRHTATLLTCPAGLECSWGGKVLLAGGYLTGVFPLPKAEIYDPVEHQFDPTANDIDWRAEHAAVSLTAGPHAGKIMLVGGTGNYPDLAVAADLFDPSTSSFSPGPSLTTPRFRHTATGLADGRIVVAGGQERWISSGAISSVEIYSPIDNRFSPAIDLKVDRQDHAAYALTSGPRAGNVLIAGGGGFSGLAARSAEVVDADAAATALHISTASLPDGSVGTPYPTTQLAASGGSGSGYVFEHVWGQLPDGLSFTAGAIEGSPQVGGVFAVGFRVTDSANNTAVKSFTIAINRLNITSPQQLPDGVINVDYGPYQITATGVGALTWTLENPLPADLTFNNGVISGTPRSTGFFGFNVRVRDAAGQVAVKHFNLRIDGPLSITTTSLGDGILGNTYGGCINRSSGFGNITWTLSGEVPKGLAFRNNGVNDGCFDTTFPARQLRETGEFTFTVTATDSSVPPQTDSKQFTIQIHAHEQAFGGPLGGTVQLTSGNKYAQVFTAGTQFDLSAIELWTLQSCSPNTTINVEIRGVIGAPARPDDTGGPLATASALGSSSGFFHPVLRLTAPVAIPQHGQFAVVVTLQNGSCQAMHWPTTDNYLQGDGWLNDGTGWRLLADAIGIPDMRINTLVIPNGLVYPSSRRDHGHRSVMLNDGRILLLGPDATADIYDPVTHTLTPTGSMSTPRANATATVLTDGRVVVIGGHIFEPATNTTTALSSIEVFDPRANDGAGTFSSGGSLQTGRANHAATLLDGNRILVTGGYAWPGNVLDHLRTAEIYDVAAQSSTLPFDMLMSRAQHTATLLPANKVLIAGGYSDGPFPGRNAEIYDADAHRFEPTANQMAHFRAQHTATVLVSGGRATQVMLIGGTGNHPDLAGNEYFDPETRMFSPAPPLLRPRTQHATVTLFHGQLMILGGYDRFGPDGQTIANVEVFDPVLEQFRPAPDLRVTRSQPFAHMLTTGTRAGMVFTEGGASSSALAARSAEIVPDAPAAFLISTAALPDGSVGVAYPVTTLSLFRGFGPFTFAHVWGQLPPGLTFVDGVFSGTPQTRGSYPIVVEATDAIGQKARKSFTIAINRLTITSSRELPEATVNADYSHQLTADGVGPLQWVLIFNQQLPADLTFTANGLISGRSRSAGFFGFEVRVRDATGQIAVKHFTLRVLVPLNIAGTNLPDGFAGEFGGGGVFVEGGSGQRFFSVVDRSKLPRGTDVDPTGGFMVGTPLETGTFAFELRVTDCFNNSCAPGITPQTDTETVTWRIVAIDQRSDGDFSGGGQSVAIRGIMPAQRVAITGVTGTSGFLLGVRLRQVTCEPGSRLRLELYPATGDPAVPDESNSPLAFTMRVNPMSWQALTFDGLGHYLPLGSSFAIVLSADGACALGSASANDTYPRGRALVNSTATNGWVPGTTPDVPWETIVLPDTMFTWSEHHFSGHTSARLDANRVLLIGGTGDQVAQLYDASAAGALSPAGTMIERRYQATATLLPDGRVVVIGGERYTPTGTEYSASAEIWDPSNNTWTRVNDDMPEPRSQHTATLLINGFVLVAGGFNSSGVLQSAVIFDPSATGTGAFRPIANLRRGRAAHTASAIVTGMEQGKVLLAGGWHGPATENVSFELFDPELESFARVDADGGPVQMAIPRARHTATTLPSGQILFIGGQWTNGSALATHAELFTPASIDRFYSTTEISGAHLTPRVEHTATLLPDGSVIVAGGFDHGNWDNVTTPTTERWLPATGTFRGNGNLGVGRADHSAEVFADGTIVFAGGTDLSTITAHSLQRFAYDEAIGVSAYSLPEAGVANAYSHFVEGTGGSGAYFFQVVSGSLPAGLALQDNGLITGTPATAGTSTFTVKITDINTREVAYATLRIEVKTTFDIVRNILRAVVGEPFTGDLQATGGNGAVMWELQSGYGEIPEGLTVDNDGHLSGTPTKAGHFSFAIRANDTDVAFPQNATQRIRVSVADRDQEQLDRVTTIAAGPSVVIAQVVTAGVAGTLSAVRLPIMCTSGSAVVDVRNAFNGQPGQESLAQRFFPNAASAFATEGWSTIALPPVFVRQGEQFAIVVIAAEFGTCSLSTGAVGQTYGGGDLFSSPPFDQFNWTREDRDLAFETLIEPVRFTHFGTASIDGQISADEWTAAGQMHFDVALPDGNTTPATLMVMNDTTDVHMSIVYERDARDARAHANFNTDNDNDGRSYQLGEDLWSLGGDGTSPSSLADMVGVAGDCPPPHACQWVNDFTRGTNDGQGRVGLADRVFAFELKHALNSGDPDDIALGPGQRFGVNINMTVHSTQQFDSGEGFTLIPTHFSKAVPITVVARP